MCMLMSIPSLSLRGLPLLGFAELLALMGGGEEGKEQRILDCKDRRDLLAHCYSTTREETEAQRGEVYPPVWSRAMPDSGSSSLSPH